MDKNVPQVKFVIVQCFITLTIIIKFSFLLIISAELKMDLLREREFKDSLERQLTEERKLRGKINQFFQFYSFSRSELIISKKQNMI